MNLTRRPSYGVLTLTPQFLRQLRQEWSPVESLPASRAAAADAGEAGRGGLAQIIPFPTGAGGWTPPAGAQRMMAA